jgi:exopolyphosphatase/guanosine-5'-triphosphate,3'-diphosphate pyrophosphatase
MVFDIGGGSTELVLVETRPDDTPLIHDWQSVPWGVVSLTESCPAEPDDAVGRAARYEQMKGLVRDSLASFAGRAADWLAQAENRKSLRLLGTSGTVTTLASLHLELPQYDRSAVDGLIVETGSMHALCRSLARMTPAERRAQPCIGRERSDLVVAGCAILEAIIELWPADQLGVADRGIREGILRGLMASGGAGDKARANLRRTKHGEG